MKIWVVMEQYEQDDDGDWDRDIAAVHASREGAEANLTPEGQWHVRDIVEMDLLP